MLPTTSAVAIHRPIERFSFGRAPRGRACASGGGVHVLLLGRSTAGVGCVDDAPIVRPPAIAPSSGASPAHVAEDYGAMASALTRMAEGASCVASAPMSHVVSRPAPARTARAALARARRGGRARRAADAGRRALRERGRRAARGGRAERHAEAARGEPLASAAAPAARQPAHRGAARVGRGRRRARRRGRRRRGARRRRGEHAHRLPPGVACGPRDRGARRDDPRRRPP